MTLTRPGPIAVVRAGVIAPMPAFIAERGGRPDRVFQQAGVPIELVAQPESVLSVRDHHLILEAAARELGDEHFGVSLGAGSDIADLGTFGCLVAGASTVRLAIATAFLALPYFAPTARTWLSFDGAMVLWYSDRIADRDRSEGRRLDGGISLMTCRSVIRRAVGPRWQPSEVLLSQATPQQLRSFERCFGAPARAAGTADALGFPRELLDLPLRFATPLADAERRAHTSRLVASSPEGSFVGSVRAIAKSQLYGGTPTVASVARSANVSVRSLQRWLAEHGTAFSDVIAAARREMAEEMLADRSRNLLDVALALGYANAANFTRAFRSWTGLAPSEYRRTRGKTGRAA